MPFGPYDLHGEVYDQFREAQIAVVVLLADDHECLHKAVRIPWIPATQSMGRVVHGHFV